MACIKRFVLFRHSLYFGVEWIFKSMICNCLDAGSLQIGFIQIQCLIMRPRKILLNHFVISFKLAIFFHKSLIYPAMLKVYFWILNQEILD